MIAALRFYAVDYGLYDF